MKPNNKPEKGAMGERRRNDMEGEKSSLAAGKEYRYACEVFQDNEGGVAPFIHAPVGGGLRTQNRRAFAPVPLTQ